MIRLYCKSRAQNRCLTQQMAELRQQNDDLQQASTEAEAKAGWERACANKEMRRLEDQLAKQRQDHQDTAEQIVWLRKKCKTRTRRHREVRQRLEALDQTMDRNIAENQRLSQALERTHEHVFEMCKRYMPSAMTAVTHGDDTADELLSILEDHLQRRQAQMSLRHSQRMGRLLDELDAEQQRRAKLAHEVDRRDRQWRHWLTERRRELEVSYVSWVGMCGSDMTGPEVRGGGAPSCGHPDAEAVSLTQCRTVLCEGCDRQMQKAIIADCTVMDCPWCGGCCSVLPLPKSLTFPWMARWTEMVDQQAMSCRMVGDMVGE